MNRADLHAVLPVLLKRLFTWGLASAALFLTFWYLGGLVLWGYLLHGLFAIIPFVPDVDFQVAVQHQPHAFLYNIPIEAGKTAQLTFPINQLNSTLVTVVTLIAMWPHKSKTKFFALSFWCLLLIALYHMFQITIQSYSAQIGPDFANQRQVFWEPTPWYVFVDYLAAFDKFILRYWAGFPVFFLALGVQSWQEQGKSNSRTPIRSKKKNRKR